jgi:hypothetical protein
MNLLVSAFGLLLFGLGIYGLVSPQGVIGPLQSLASSQRMGIAVGVRAVMGLIFLLAADTCRHPTVITVIGAIALIAAALLPLFGAKRLDAMLDWLLSRPPALLRSWFVAALAIGAYLAWVGLPA